MSHLNTLEGTPVLYVHGYGVASQQAGVWGPMLVEPHPRSPGALLAQGSFQQMWPPAGHTGIFH